MTVIILMRNYYLLNSKIFNQIKEENIYNELCDIYKSITVAQYDNEEDAESCIAYIENFHKTYSIRKLLKNINKD